MKVNEPFLALWNAYFCRYSNADCAKVFNDDEWHFHGNNNAAAVSARIRWQKHWSECTIEPFKGTLFLLPFRYLALF